MKAIDDPARMRAYRDKWRANNPEKVKAAAAKYRAANRAKLAADNAQWRKDNRERANELARAWRAANKAKVAEIKKRSEEKAPEKKQAYRQAYYEANKERTIADALAWAAANPEAVRITNWLRHRRLRQATPRWADIAALRAFREACPAGQHIDHIVPLHGVRAGKHVVCGLNVPWNLQYLTPSENCSKRNFV
jgi:hypothetical protein